MPVASESLHEPYDALLISGDDEDIIGTDLTVNCTLYLGEGAILFSFFFASQLCLSLASLAALFRNQLLLPLHMPDAKRTALLCVTARASFVGNLWSGRHSYLCLIASTRGRLVAFRQRRTRILIGQRYSAVLMYALFFYRQKNATV